MRDQRTARPLRLLLIGLVALFSGLATLAVASGHDALAQGDDDHAQSAARDGDVSRSELRLRTGMRELWDDHVTWTRLAIVSLTTDAPDTEATVGRLLANQDDIAGAVKPFYGQAAADALSGELRRHILIAADVIAAARAGDADALAESQARWTANADDLAALLASVNPRYWPEARLRAELHTHLELTTAEAVARLEADWDADVAAYDEVTRHARHFADLLSDGLVRQFPSRFR